MDPDFHDKPERIRREREKRRALPSSDPDNP